MEIVISIIAKIGEYLVEPIGQQFGYLIHLNSNIQNLKDQFQKLGDKRKGLQLEIDAAKRNGLEILPEVNTWIEKVDNISQGLQRFIDIEDKMCLNLKSRYSLSKKAKKKTLEIDGLLKEAEQTFFNKVSYSPRPLGVVSTEVFKHFESRKSIMKEVLEALRDDNINMIAICGMGGIGKTTMAKEVAKRAKDAKLFDEDVMAVVSQKQDVKHIQGQIADMLHLQLKTESLQERANQLSKRLMNSESVDIKEKKDIKSVLVILDDVWDALNLMDVGIPCGGQNKRCKILLTSRSEEACNQMRSQKIVPIKVLSEEEAWNLFREMAGDCVDTPGLRPIAKEVAKECNGLPVAIVTVGRALENKSEVEWIAALQQLKMSIPKHIPGLDSKVYSSIELSYSYLKSEEAKSCFLLCCLFPEDYDIPIEYLVRSGVGRRIFARNNVAEARYEVHAMVKNLKRSFLLLDSLKEECVKMHDVIRDVAISIADKQGFLVRCDAKLEEWPEKDTYEHYAAISLFSREIKRHPDGTECSKLELLQLSCSKNSSQTLPANLFQGMKELKVLSMRGMSFPSLPQSIRVLQNLRTLSLEYCGLQDVSAIGALGKLEMLSFLGSEIKELPREIGNLGHLKLLDLSVCTTLQRIPYGLLSSLSRLEELYIGDVPVNWEPTGNSEGDNASLAELIPLSHLMALKLYISKSNIKLLPKDLHFKNQMIKFQIRVTGQMTRGWLFHFDQTACYLLNNKVIFEEIDASDIKESRLLCQLLEKSEILELRNIKDLKSILYELHQEDLPCLKVLTVSFSNVEYVIDATSDQTPRDAFPILESLSLAYLSNLKEIYHGQFQERSFSGAQLACFGNLTSLRLDACYRLKNVFSLSIARGLVQLQELFIRGCTDMEEIFSKEGQDEKAFDMIKFPQLKYVGLGYLPRLIGFCTFVDPIELVQPSHAKGTQPILNQEIGKINTEQHEQHHTGSFPESGSISNKFLSSMTIFWSPNLGELVMWYNDSLEVLFDLEGLMVQPQRIDVLAQLKTLTLRELSRLMYVWKNFSRGILGFQNLTSISVSSCPNLRYLFPPSIAKLLVELQSVNLGGSDMMENIVRRDGEEEAVDTIVFPKVSSFKLHHLRNLMSFCVEAYSFEWPSMKEIKINDCDKLKTFGSEIQSPRKRKKIKGLDSRPQEPGVGSSSIRSSPGFLGRCLECVPHRRNYGLVDLSDHMCPTKKSHGSSSVNKEGTLTKLKDQRANVVDKPLEIWSFFPSNMIECLKNLEVIELEMCHSIEAIFQLEELNVEENHVASVLNQLRDLKLNVLPKMMHIWKKGPERIMGFGNLRLLEVRKCNSLTYLFSPSIAKLLVMLEEIQVIDCEKIEEILTRAREEEGEEKDIVLFNKVNLLMLMDLPNLKCFCNEANAFEWPSLKKVGVIRCPNLRTFVPANIKTPELEGVYEDYRYNRESYKFEFKERAQWKGDLNATIEHIFKGKEPKVDHETQQQEQTETTEKNM
uniref:AAA+ ATPase domain-containing protein n=1 Tax=Fagus sylvatica TaxID=28930 RepID=A0A2N9GTG6_FAGSY